MHLAVSTLHVNNMCVIIPSRLNMTCSCSEMRCISLLERLLVCVRYCTPKVQLGPTLLVHGAKQLRTTAVGRGWCFNVPYMDM